MALAGLIAVLGLDQGSAELAAVAAGVLAAARPAFCPAVLRRALAPAGEDRRETRPLVNVAASLLAAAVLTLLAYAVSRPLVDAGDPHRPRRPSRSGWPWC